MKYLPVVIVLVLGWSQTSVAEKNEVGKTTKITNEKCQSVDAGLSSSPLKGLESDAMKQFNLESDGAVDVEEKLLRKHDAKMSKILRVEDWKSLGLRQRLPILGPYINAKKGPFLDLQMKTIFNLLGKTGQVLRVAYGGCKEFKCATGVHKVMESYQQLILQSKKMSKNMVYSCIRALKFIRYAYLYVTLERFRNKREKSLKQLNRTIPIARDIQNQSSKVANDTDHLIGKSKNVVTQIDDDKKVSKAEYEAYKNKMTLLEQKTFNLTQMYENMKNKSETLEENIQKIKDQEKTILTKEEYEKNKKVLSNKCEMVKKAKFKEICSTVNHWWFGSSRKCEMKQGFETERECKLKLDKFLVELRNDELRSLAKDKRSLRQQRLDHQKQKLKLNLMQQEQFASLRESGKRLTALKYVEDDKKGMLQIAKTSLDVARRAMVIVHMQLLKLEEFWEDIVSHTTRMIQSADDRKAGDDKEAAEAEGRKPIVLEAAFSWMALGNVLSDAYYELEETTKTVQTAFMKFPTSKEVKHVIEIEAKQILNSTIELADSFGKNEDKTRAKIELMVKCDKQFPPAQNIAEKYGDAEDADDLEEMDEMD